MTVSIRHCVVVDAETLIERTHAVALIADALLQDPVWTGDGDIGRRRTARRIAYQRWRFREIRVARAALRRWTR